VAWVMLSALLGGLLLVSGVPKLRDRSGTLTAVQAYRLLPDRVERAAAVLLAPAEVGIGAMLVLGIAPRPAAAAAAVLFVAFAAGLAVNLRRGRRALHCGCFTFLESDRAPRIDWFHAARAAVLAAGAAWLAVASSPFGLGRTALGEHALGVALVAVVLAAGCAAAVVRGVVTTGRRGVDDHLSSARIELSGASGPSRPARALVRH
jgi:Methylamine utilisation protein MauE